MVKVAQKNLAVGLNRGYVTTPLKKTAKQASKVRQSRTKPVLGKRIKVIRQVITEVPPALSRLLGNLSMRRESLSY